MRRLGNIVARLTAARRAIDAMSANDDDVLSEMTGFGPNAGQLRALSFVPANLPRGAPLVVVLHGCTQNAAVYDQGSGWSQLAAREGFAVLFPEQRRTNNANLCFNWYAPKDARRNRGEALSISQMVTHMTALHGLDPSRVFVTGLSAGGAMTSVMLAAYPELFAGGAIIAGLPFATADTLPEALARMRGPGGPTRRELAARARAAAKHEGPLPTLSVWHGTRDTIVDPVNADAIVDQWRDLHGLGTTTGVVDRVGDHRHETWRDADGRALVERYDVQGMGHGTPLATRGDEKCGNAGPHMLDAGICSTTRIATFWGLTDASPAKSEPRRRIEGRESGNPAEAAPTLADQHQALVGTVIEDTLRAVGLMRWGR